MTRLEKFNHIIFAVLGTCCILGIIVGIILTIFNNSSQNQILSQDRTAALAKGHKRQQILSLGEPIAIDSINGYYLIPVSQKTLNHRESIGSSIISKSEERFSYSGSRFYFQNPLNNFVLYNGKISLWKVLFHSKICINHFEIYGNDSNKRILIYCSQIDSDKDGVLSENDLQDLCIFTLKDQQLKFVSVPNATILNSINLKGNPNLILCVGLDRDRNGKYDEYEPEIWKEYNLQTGQISDFMDTTMLSEMQSILEGTAKNAQR